MGGTDCAEFAVVSSSVLACRLPGKGAGSVNEIVVTNGGVNVTPASTYTHMKITYFDPEVAAGSTVSVGGGTALRFYPGGFTADDCAVLTPSNSTVLNEYSSTAYVRDGRNGQIIDYVNSNYSII